jgi:hypothetical protein
MFPLKPNSSKPVPQDQDPSSPPWRPLAVAALSFTLVLIQVQAVYQGNPRNLLPILIAALMLVIGVAG